MIQAKKMIDYPNDQVQQATPQTKAETSKSKRNNHPSQFQWKWCKRLFECRKPVWARPSWPSLPMTRRQRPKRASNQALQDLIRHQRFRPRENWWATRQSRTLNSQTWWCRCLEVRIFSRWASTSTLLPKQKPTRDIWRLVSLRMLSEKLKSAHMFILLKLAHL